MLIADGRNRDFYPFLAMGTQEDTLEWHLHLRVRKQKRVKHTAPKINKQGLYEWTKLGQPQLNFLLFTTSFTSLVH